MPVGQHLEIGYSHTGRAELTLSVVCKCKTSVSFQLNLSEKFVLLNILGDESDDNFCKRQVELDKHIYLHRVNDSKVKELCQP